MAKQDTTERGWEETRNLNSTDRFLRLNGFRIEARPRTGEAIWSCGGQFYGQVEALLLCERGPRKSV